jgi:ABC-type amino acid transport substrate-binding protein
VAASANDSIALRVGIYDNEPKIFMDANGEPSGFWPDVIDYIAQEEGWSIAYIHGTWDECLSGLEKDEIDVMPDVAYTEERGKKT